MIRSENPEGVRLATQALENLKLKNDSRSLNFFNAIGQKALREPVFSRFLYHLLQSESLLREDALAVLAGQAMEGYGPDRALVQLCVEVIRKGDLQPTKAYYLSGRGGVGKEQRTCEWMLYFMETGKNLRENLSQIKHGSKALSIAQKWLKARGDQE